MNLGSFARFSGVLDQSEGKKMTYCKIQIQLQKGRTLTGHLGSPMYHWEKFSQMPRKICPNDTTYGNCWNQRVFGFFQPYVEQIPIEFFNFDFFLSKLASEIQDYGVQRHLTIF